jgi:ribosomal protein S18 acetylase RimI-like enzyme
MPAPLVRRFEPSDRDEVIALWERCELTRPWNDPRRDIDRKSATDPAGFLVAVDTATGAIVATVMAGYDGHRGWINYLAVDPDRRGTGLGRAIMAAAEGELGTRGCPKVNLQVRTSNADALRFYERLGYTTDDVVSLGRRLIHDA